MNYYIVTDSHTFLYVVAQEKTEDVESVEFNEVSFMMVIKDDERAFLSGSETFFEYECDEPDAFTVSKVSLNGIIDRIKHSSSKIIDRHTAIKAFFEPNLNGNN